MTSHYHWCAFDYIVSMSFSSANMKGGITYICLYVLTCHYAGLMRFHEACTEVKVTFMYITCYTYCIDSDTVTKIRGLRINKYYMF